MRGFIRKFTKCARETAQPIADDGQRRGVAMPTKKPKATDVLVGQRVRMARLMASMSQTELGENIGITFQQVQKYEKGGNRISSSRLAQISEVLGKPVSWF